MAVVHILVLWAIPLGFLALATLIVHLVDEDDNKYEPAPPGPLLSLGPLHLLTSRPSLSLSRPRRIVVFGVQPIYWTAFIASVIFLWYAVGIVVRIFFYLLRVLPGFRWLYSLVVHFVDPLQVAVWGLLAILGWSELLKNEAEAPAGNKTKSASSDRVGRFLLAFVLSALVFSVVRGVLLLIQFANLKNLSDKMEESGFWCVTLRPPVRKYDDSYGRHIAMPKYMKNNMRGGLGRVLDALNLGRVGILQKLKVIDQGERTRLWGLHSLTPRMPAPTLTNNGQPDKELLTREVMISAACFVNEVLIKSGRMSEVISGRLPSEDHSLSKSASSASASSSSSTSASESASSSGSGSGSGSGSSSSSADDGGEGEGTLGAVETRVGFAYDVSQIKLTYKMVLEYSKHMENRAERLFKRLKDSKPKKSLAEREADVRAKKNFDARNRQLIAAGQTAEPAKEEKIDFDTVQRAVLSVYRDHMELVNAIEGRQVVTNVSKTLLHFVAFFFSLLFFVAAFEIDLVTLLVPVASLFLAASFAFSSVLSDFVWSLNLIYFVRPYDLRDIVRIGNDPTTFIVARVSMMSTYMQDLDGLTHIFPNGLIAKGRIFNLSRCATAAVSFTYTLDFDITEEELLELRTAMTAFVGTWPDIYKGICAVVLVGVGADTKFELLVKAPVTFPYKERAAWLEARDKLHFAFVNVVRSSDLAFGADYKVKTMKIE